VIYAALHDVSIKPRQVQPSKVIALHRLHIQAKHKAKMYHYYHNAFAE
jgi:hypothetical protein